MSTPSANAATDIIIPVHNQCSFTRNLIESIYRHTDVPFHIYVIDNASTDETVDLLEAYSRDITVVYNAENRGWCGGVNQGVKLGHHPNVVLMNNDVEVGKNWLVNMLAFLDSHPRIGAVGPLDSNPNDWQYVDRVRSTCVPTIPDFQTEDLHERNKILQNHFNRSGILIEGMLAFFCVLMKRRTMDRVGLLDESFIGGGDDDDYCRRLVGAGFVLGLSLDTYVLHHSSQTAKTVFDAATQKENRERNLTLLREKHPGYY